MLQYAKMLLTFTVSNGGQLLLANSFECMQTEDRIYYLLYVWKLLEEFNQERDELHSDRDTVR